MLKETKGGEQICEKKISYLCEEPLTEANSENYELGATKHNNKITVVVLRDKESSRNPNVNIRRALCFLWTEILQWTEPKATPKMVTLEPSRRNDDH